MGGGRNGKTVKGRVVGVRILFYRRNVVGFYVYMFSCGSKIEQCQYLYIPTSRSSHAQRTAVSLHCGNAELLSGTSTSLLLFSDIFPTRYSILQL